MLLYCILYIFILLYFVDPTIRLKVSSRKKRVVATDVVPGHHNSERSPSNTYWHLHLYQIIHPDCYYIFIHLKNFFLINRYAFVIQLYPSDIQPIWYQSLFFIKVWFFLQLSGLPCWGRHEVKVTIKWKGMTSTGMMAGASSVYSISK